MFTVRSHIFQTRWSVQYLSVCSQSHPADLRQEPGGGLQGLRQPDRAAGPGAALLDPVPRVQARPQHRGDQCGQCGPGINIIREREI